ncbi:hypothetical protein J1614_010705 [Plenodomus biglobosus]|nr:hypothetical protein J1614_010705 [Plenodomus biglobosus]
MRKFRRGIKLLLVHRQRPRRLKLAVAIELSLAIEPSLPSDQRCRSDKFVSLGSWNYTSLYGDAVSTSGPQSKPSADGFDLALAVIAEVIRSLKD